MERDRSPIRNRIENPNMAANYTLMKMYIDTIPHFDGNPFILNPFIKACNELTDHFQNPGEPNIATFLKQAIISKLQGQAQMIVCSRTELDTWELIKNHLIDNFGDPQDLSCIQQDLIHSTYNKGKETLKDFGNKILELQSLLLNKLNLLPLPAADKVVRTNMYKEMSLNAYTLNLPFDYQLMVRTRNLDNLEQAISLVNREEQFKQYRSSIHNSSKPFQQTPQNRQPPQNQNRQPFQPFQNRQSFQPFQNRQPFQPFQNRQPFQPFQNRQSFQPFQSRQPFHPQNHQPFQQTNQSFPRGPINIQPRPLNNPKYPTAAQTFGKPINVWKSKPNFGNPKPTPMSGVSTIPYTPPQARPTFHSEELFHTEADISSQPYSYGTMFCPYNNTLDIPYNNTLEVPYNNTQIENNLQDDFTNIDLTTTETLEDSDNEDYQNFHEPENLDNPT